MPPGDNWRPGATLHTLQLAARLRRCLREWFHASDTLEVGTPLLGVAGTTDPNIQSLSVASLSDGPHQALREGRSHWYLHTSPEFAMKRLLAAFGVDLYQIAPVFRAGEQGRRHNPEFTLVEWYRVGFGLEALIDELCALLQALCAEFDCPWHAPVRVSYVDAVSGELKRAFDTITLADVQAHFLAADRPWPAGLGADELDAALDLFIDEFVLPGFPADRLTVFTEYPASQASLARTTVSASGVPIAERVELYWGTLELANGFHELCDATEQRRRFEADNATRIERGLKPVPLDELLLAALAAGLPDCSGVALGFERLLMVLSDLGSIQEAMSFDCERA